MVLSVRRAGMTLTSMPGLCLVAVLLSAPFSTCLTRSPRICSKLLSLLSRHRGFRCPPHYEDNLLKMMSLQYGKEIPMLTEKDEIVEPAMTSSGLPLRQDDDGALAEKRLKPEFNPTGWRRKRDVSGVFDAKRVWDSLNYPQTQWGDRDSVMSPQKRQSFNRYRNVLLKPKRKPLEFNPTGW